MTFLAFQPWMIKDLFKMEKFNFIKIKHGIANFMTLKYFSFFCENFNVWLAFHERFWKRKRWTWLKTSNNAQIFSNVRNFSHPKGNGNYVWKKLICDGIFINFLFFSHLCNSFFAQFFTRTSQMNKKKEKEKWKEETIYKFCSLLLLFRAVHRCL